MVTGYILVQTELGKSAEVLSSIKHVSGVNEAVIVTGPYDIVAKAEAAGVDELGRLVAGEIQAVPGIAHTLTCPVIRI